MADWTTRCQLGAGTSWFTKAHGPGEGGRSLLPASGNSSCGICQQTCPHRVNGRLLWRKNSVSGQHPVHSPLNKKGRTKELIIREEKDLRRKWRWLLWLVLWMTVANILKHYLNTFGTNQGVMITNSFPFWGNRPEFQAIPDSPTAYGFLETGVSSQPCRDAQRSQTPTLPRQNVLHCPILFRRVRNDSYTGQVSVACGLSSKELWTSFQRTIAKLPGTVMVRELYTVCLYD